MFLNVKFFPRLTSINAVSKAKSTTVTSSYVDVSRYAKVLTLFNFGDLDSGQATMNFLQAVDASGTSSKALTAGNFAQATTTTNNAKVEVEEFVDKMDGANGFDCIAAQVVLDANVATAAVYAVDIRGVEPDFKS